MTKYSDDTVKIVISQVIKNELCVTQSDGEKVFDIIHHSLRNGYKIRLSFAGVRYTISAFLNPAIGMLYKYYTSEQLNSNLKIEEATPTQLKMVREVLRNAKEYYSNQHLAESNLIEAIDEEL
jgi:hypothetical protein